MGIADRITVLNFGKKIAEGHAEDIQTDPVVLGVSWHKVMVFLHIEGLCVRMDMFLH